MNNTIPDEIEEFFSKESGSSLIVQGLPGAGKTLFALELLEEFTEFNPIYLSTRVPLDALYEQFPRLKKRYKETQLIDACKKFLKTPPNNDIELVENARNFLKMIGYGKKDTEKRVSRVNKYQLEFYGLFDGQDKVTDLNEIILACDKIDSNLPKPSILILDSVEGLCSKYRIPEVDLIEMLNEILVSQVNTKLILILEKQYDIGLDYLVDGVITLHYKETNGRLYRSIELNKLRGLKIDQPKYLFTLNNGRFKSFKSFKAKYPKEHKRFKIIPDNKIYFSTGIKDLDHILDGGYPRGSYVLLEIGKKVDYDFLGHIPMLTAANFVSQNKGVVMHSVGGNGIKEVMNYVFRYGLGDKLNLFRVVIEENPEEPRTENFVVTYPTNYKNNGFNILDSELQKLRNEIKDDVLKIVDYSILETQLGKEILPRLIISDKKYISANNLLAIVISRNSNSNEIKDMLSDAANIHLKLEKKNRALILYCEKPETCLYAVEPDSEALDNGYPDIKLTPIV